MSEIYFVVFEYVFGELFYKGSHVAVVHLVSEVVHLQLQNCAWIFVLTESGIFPAKSGLVLLWHICLLKVKLDNLGPSVGVRLGGPDQAANRPV